MTSELDIYRSANELINQHGEEAPIEAAMRADELMEAGDMEGEAVWLRIGRAIEELRQREPQRLQPQPAATPARTGTPALSSGSCAISISTDPLRLATSLTGFTQAARSAVHPAARRSSSV